MAGGEEEENMEALDQARDESSDDDIVIVPESVDNYWLEHGDKTPVSFATLPYFKTGEDTVTDEVYVRGTQDGGMRLYMRVVSWKLELPKDIKPVFHLKTEKYWIQLLKPRKSYEETIRSVMSTAQFLNFALINPDASEKAAWSHVKDVFPSWEISPSRNDLSSHLTVIRHLVASDEHLAAASALQTLDIGVSKKRLASATEDGRQSSRKGMYVSDDEDNGGGEMELQREQKRGKFELNDLNSEEEMDGYGEETDGSEEAADLSETVCCICDNGGTVICCDGPCMRSFHLNKGAGGADDSHCSTLGFSKSEAERMDKFFCPNCKFKKHQCYACGRLGCSDEAAGAAQEVFVCDAAMCGHFYHPTCVAALILRDKDSSEQDALVESIKEKKGFVCTMHKCWKCGKGEDKDDRDLQFGICRRCPRVWHRKCLPFPVPNDDASSDEDSENENESENDEPRRAWDKLLPNRILVYCTRHTIIPNLGTPARSHVRFPEGSLPSAKKVLVKSRPEDQERKSKLLKLGSKKDTASLKSGAGLKISKLDDTKKTKHVITKSKLDRDGSAPRVSTSKASEKKTGPFLIKGRADITKKDWSSLEDLQKPLSLTKGRLDTDVKLERSSSMVSKSSTPRESALQQKSKPPVAKAIVIDSQTKSMVNDIIERNKALVTIESVTKKQDIPACYRRHSKNPDKKYSLFKIESITKGMRKALETLETGGSIEDAKAKCSPDLIRFIELCRNDLRVYLSPLLHGARYTSFGRHFTKSEKLEEIVDRLHSYVEKGDMIVDFCCGANEFSLFMRRKLEETGKKCDYKNFDLIQTKNDFNFSKRDWFQVSPNELPDGNRLIMGLNPPFGVKGHLANQFIDHALKFRPKLVVLIVPKETERLDRKPDMYDLVWEDSDLLAGQSFYLPGSVDVDDKPLNDWNVVAPPLYLWSRPDWTSTHREIALNKGHISAISSSRFVGSPWKPPPCPASPSSLLDLGVDNDANQMAPIELGEKDEKIKSYKTLVQPRTVDELTGVQETGPKLDRSSSAKLKNQNKKSREPLDSRIGDGPAIIPDTQIKDNTSNNSKVKTTTEFARKDGSVPEKQPERRRLESLKKVSEGSQANPKIVKNAKREDLPKRKSSEGQAYLHAQRNPQTTDKSKPSSQESPEVTRRTSEARHDVSRKDRKLNDRYDRGDEPWTDPKFNDPYDQGDGPRTDPKFNDRYDRGDDPRTDPKFNDRYDRGDDSRTAPSRDLEWKRAAEKHRLSAEADMSGRRSPHRHDKYESGRRKSPDKYDRYGGNRHGEDRKASPERSRHGTKANEPRKGSPDKSRYGSSVVDLDTLFSSSDAKNDRSRGYDDHTRKSTGKDYQDSSFYRGGSPNRRLSEDSKRSWVNMDSYQGASENHPRTNDTAYMTNSYDGMAPYRVQHAEVQVNSLGRPYPDPAYGVQMSRPTDFYPPDLSRGMPGLPSVNYRDDRYGVPMRTEGPFRESAAGGLGLLPERSFQAPWPGTMPAPVVYNSAYGSQIPQQALVDPSLLSSHGLFDNRLAQTQSHRPQYPPRQGRLSGQGNQQFSGGWFDD